MFFTAHMLQKNLCAIQTLRIVSFRDCITSSLLFFLLAFAGCVFSQLTLNASPSCALLHFFILHKRYPLNVAHSCRPCHLKVSTCVCMFSEHQRPYSRDALHGSKRLRKNIADLFASNAVSAEGGVQDCLPNNSKRLAVRNRRKNASRDLRAKLLRDSLWPST